MPDGESDWSQGPPSEAPSNTDASVATPLDAFDTQQIHALARHPPPGASVYLPSAAVSSSLNPRSCVTCRRRKVRCDKHMPCSNCRRAQIPCIFPAPGRAPRRPRAKDPNAPPKHPSSERELELLKRLRKLEGIVEELSGQVEDTARQPSSAGNSPEAAARDLDDRLMGRRHGSAPSGSGSPHSQDSPATLSGGAIARSRTTPGSSSSLGPLRKTSDVHKQFGRLVLNDKGVSRYVSSAFWSAVNDELDEIRRETHDLTEEDSEDSDLEDSAVATEQERSISHQSFIFGYRSADVDLRPLHPLPSQIPFMWQVFQENVDPILKILHVPTTNKLVRDVRKNLDTLTASTETLMFGIYYAAITSLDEEEVKLNFNAEKSELLERYRFALEQALARSNFMTTPDLTVAQALLLFLVLVRRHDATRFTWTMTGLLVRVSQALGLHRDGTNFPNLSPYEIEMRRRLFWGVCVLDLRSSEDQGTDLLIMDHTFDTKAPLNINDTDISPESTELPKARDGPTDMTFSLIRYDICHLGRRMHMASSDISAMGARDTVEKIEEREALLSDVHKRVEKEYLKDGACDKNPMYWTAANISRLIVAKMRLIIYQSVLFPGPENEVLSEDKRDRLFNAATEVYEYSYLLNTDPRCKQWRWLFQTYTQLHAAAYGLIEMCHREWSATVERSWTALNLVFSDTNPSLPQFDLQKMTENSAVWLPLRKLYMMAKRHREAEIARLSADPAAAQRLELEDRARVPPGTVAGQPTTTRDGYSAERWRKLVNAPPLPADAPAPRQPNEKAVPPPPPAQVHANPPVGAGIPGPAPCPEHEIKPEFMDYLDDTLTRPDFNGSMLVPLWSKIPHTMLNQSQDMFGLSSGMQQNDDLPFGGTPMPTYDGLNVAGGHASQLHNAPVSHGSQQQHNAPVSHGSQQQHNAPVSHGSQQQQHQQHQHHQQHQQHDPLGQLRNMTASPLRDHRDLPPWMWPDNGLGVVSNLPAEELDVNMDEGFDWQNWQESLGRFELETNGGPANAAWGPGI